MKKRTILVGITGGIAVYKIANLVRLYKKRGWNVIVVMTENATKFVSPLTFETLTENSVVLDTFKRVTGYETNMEHINLPDITDVFVCAPATANILGKMANGIADDILSTTFLSLKKNTPKLICPAMNVKMWENPATQRNITLLKDFGYDVLEPDTGDLACGISAKGRLPAESVILKYTERALMEKPLHGKKVVVSSGATIEPIDPVRYVTNHSSGKMGVAVAETFWKLGAEVSLVSGIYSEKSNIIPQEFVKSVDEMYHAITAKLDAGYDHLVMTAAVSDYTPKLVYDKKVKKSDAPVIIEFVRTKDIIKEVSQHYSVKIIGFAAETDNVLEYAKKKLTDKGMYMIVANDLTEKGAGFRTDTNHCYIITKEGMKDTGVVSKEAVAEEMARLL